MLTMVKTKHLKVPETVERLIIVSDLHGLVEPLEAMDRILSDIQEEFQLVASGDYFVNGAYPVEVLDWVRSKAGEFAILGNHDEGAFGAPEEDFPPYTEEGAWNRLDDARREYLTQLPHILELDWKGKRIRITHDLNPAGERVSWKARVNAVFEMFADPERDLVTCSHTHFPFVREKDGALVANTGGMSNLLIGHKREDGGIDPKGDEGVFQPDPNVSSTFLSVCTKDDKLDVRIERLHYDIDKALKTLEELGHPNLENLSVMYRTGVCWC
jgi:predicted phosphodiesterase